MIVRPAIAASFLALAACDSAPPANEAAPANATANLIDTGAAVRALTPSQRDGVLLRAVRDAGRECQGVTQSDAAGEVEGNPAWSATCTNGGQWLVVMRPGGNATVVDMTKLPR